MLIVSLSSETALSMLEALRISKLALARTLPGLPPWEMKAPFTKLKSFNSIIYFLKSSFSYSNFWLTSMDSRSLALSSCFYVRTLLKAASFPPLMSILVTCIMTSWSSLILFLYCTTLSWRLLHNILWSCNSCFIVAVSISRDLIYRYSDCICSLIWERGVPRASG